MAHAQMPPMMMAPGLLANETVCYAASMVSTNGIWVNENPMHFSLPLFLLQTMVIALTSRLLSLLYKPLNMPVIFSEFLAGIILGPSVIGLTGLGAFLISRSSVVLLETVANLGVIYFVFMVGLEMDLSLFHQHGKKALAFAFAGMFLPAVVGAGFSFFLHNFTTVNRSTFVIIFVASVSVTALPVLTRVLAELRLLDQEMGKLAKSAALINEVVSFLLMIFAVSFAEAPADKGVVVSVWVILSVTVFVAFSFFAVRPALSWLICRNPDEQNLGNLTTSVILAGVMFYGFIADTIGVHPAFGAFVFGLILPQGPLSTSIVERMEDFVMDFMVNIFFASAGLKTSIPKLLTISPAAVVALVICTLLSAAGKVVGTVVVAHLTEMPLLEGAALGLLMNSRGLVEVVALNFGKDQRVMDDTAYSMMAITMIIMNALITPLVVKIYKPARKFVPYKRRTIQNHHNKAGKAEEELRILACIHTPRNVPTMVSLLEATNPTKRSPIAVFSLHLVESTGHGSSTVIIHGPNQKSSEGAAVNKMQAQSDHIINAFEAMEQRNSSVMVQCLTAVSPYSAMHEDICSLAEEKRASFIILPFHKQQMVDGGMEAANPKFRTVNDKVLGNAPCSVGILVDRGLNGGSSSRLTATLQLSYNVAVLFFGGADDREALSYGLRMSEHLGNSLNLIRFVPGPNAVEPLQQQEEAAAEGQGVLMLQVDKEKQRQIDEEYVKEVRMMKADDDRFSYIEKVVNNGEETVAAIKSVDNIHDLFLVGRGGDGGSVSALTMGLTEWSECPELGVIGDLLASADFAATVSVMVVQQYIGGESFFDLQAPPPRDHQAQTPPHAHADIDIYTYNDAGDTSNATGGQLEEQWMMPSSSSLRYHPKPQPLYN